MKFRGVESHSTIRGIGDLFRSLDGSDWQINVKLAPTQKKQHFGISQLPILARRRVLNATAAVRPAGFNTVIPIDNTRAWNVAPISACPIPSVRRQEDANQWCFAFEHQGTWFFLPQLELARVLYFHHSYLARLSMIPQGLAQEFDVTRYKRTSLGQVNILPTCSLPRYLRGDCGPRRVLAWILFDNDVRQSFESISRNQLTDGFDSDTCRWWRFRFTPPALENALLTVRGHFDPERRAFFVYEIYGITNLDHDCPSSIRFVDPLHHNSDAAPGYVERSAASPAHQPFVDDGQDPDTDEAEIMLEIPTVALEFDRPFNTVRVGRSSARARGHFHEGEGSPQQETTETDVSTDESTVDGTLRPADYDGLEDISDDVHLYTAKFEAFEAMVMQLVAQSGCRHLHKAIRKLPAVKGCTKHLLAEGNPRCLAFHLVQYFGTGFALIEVDTSDNKNSLSTLLLKQPSPSFDWDSLLRELELQLVASSLVWPSSLLKLAFNTAYRRIPHPKTRSTNKALLEPDSIEHWAERVGALIEAL